MADAPKTPAAQPDPFAALETPALLKRVGPIAAGVWVVAILVHQAWALIGAAVLTVAVLGAIWWARRWAAKNKAVASLLQGADTPEARKAALQKLETDFKKDDTAALFAKAQLLMHEPDDGPRRALAVLEQVEVGKVLPTVADEARVQRALIHLALGETDPARSLADSIELSRHENAKSRATMAAVIGEAWARTGQAKKALETMSVFNPEDPEYAELKPQMYRALAFAHASLNDMKAVRTDLHKLAKVNPQLLAGFVQKKVHPMLRKEAEQILIRSGAMPRQTVVRRM